MSKSQKITGAVLVAAVVILTIYDLFAATYFGTQQGATLSWVVFSLSRDYPAIPFGAGILCGHLFTGMPGIKPVESK